MYLIYRLDTEQFYSSPDWKREEAKVFIDRATAQSIVDSEPSFRLIPFVGEQNGVDELQAVFLVFRIDTRCYYDGQSMTRKIVITSPTNASSNATQS